MSCAPLEACVARVPASAAGLIVHGAPRRAKPRTLPIATAVRGPGLRAAKPTAFASRRRRASSSTLALRVLEDLSLLDGRTYTINGLHEPGCAVRTALPTSEVGARMTRTSQCEP